MSVRIHASWEEHLEPEFQAPYFALLTDFVKQEYIVTRVFPDPKDIFRAFDTTPFDKIKVVILGQDPYHGVGQAHGLCFSVKDNMRMPPSLQNIFKEIISDIGGEMPMTGNLTHWAEQGVLLLNATLTVRAGQAGSHQGKGWEQFTDAVIKTISQQKEHIVFLLWGNYAKEKIALIDKSKHYILTAVHPSPFSAYQGFFGCKHFSKTNEYLLSHMIAPIQWI